MSLVRPLLMCGFIAFVVTVGLSFVGAGHVVSAIVECLAAAGVALGLFIDLRVTNEA